MLYSVQCLRTFSLDSQLAIITISIFFRKKGKMEYIGQKLASHLERPQALQTKYSEPTFAAAITAAAAFAAAFASALVG